MLAWLLRPQQKATSEEAYHYAGRKNLITFEKSTISSLNVDLRGRREAPITLGQIVSKVVCETGG
jgi:hypothetical protein